MKQPERVVQKCRVNQCVHLIFFTAAERAGNQACSAQPRRPGVTVPLVELRSFTSQLTSSGESSLYILECGKGKHLECEVIETSLLVLLVKGRREGRKEEKGETRMEEYLFSSPSLNNGTDALFSICKNSAYLLPKTRFPLQVGAKRRGQSVSSCQLSYLLSPKSTRSSSISVSQLLKTVSKMLKSHRFSFPSNPKEAFKSIHKAVCQRLKY